MKKSVIQFGILGLSLVVLAMLIFPSAVDVSLAPESRCDSLIKSYFGSLEKRGYVDGRIGNAISKSKCEKQLENYVLKNLDSLQRVSGDRERSSASCHVDLGADLNDDGDVDVYDLLAILSNWNTSNPAGDANGDGYVAVEDLLAVLAYWGLVDFCECADGIDNDADGTADYPTDLDCSSQSDDSESSGSFDTFISASRTAGVAPLGVNFNAIGNLNWPELEPLDFSWDFDNDGVMDREGYLSAYVFENPGTHVVSLRVRNVQGAVQDFETTIYVVDSNAFYSGTKTVCFSNNVDFSGCPSGAQKITTSEISEVSPFVNSNKRLLFRKGHTFNLENEISLTQKHNIMFGSFGSGTEPKIIGNQRFISIKEGNSNIVIENLYFEAENPNIIPVIRLAPIGSLETPTRELLIHKINVKNMGYILNTEDDGVAEDIVISQVSTEDLRRYGAFSYDAENLAVIDSEIQISSVSAHPDNGVEHGVRVIDGRKVLVNNNEISVGNTLEKSDVTIRGDSEYVLVSDNLIGGTIAIGSAADDNAINLRKLIFERNYFEYTGLGITRMGTDFAGKDITVRNNVYHGGNNVFVIKDHHNPSSIESENIRIYNNAFYDVKFAKISDGVENVLIKNNVWQEISVSVKENSPFELNQLSTSEFLDFVEEYEIDKNVYYLNSDSAPAKFSYGNGFGLLDWQEWRDFGFDGDSFYEVPGFVNPVGGNLRLSSSSPGIGIGESLTVRDIDLNIRPSTGQDAGAYQS